MTFKRQLATWLQRLPPLRWGMALAMRLLLPRHYVGAVGVVFNEAGEVLLVEHVFRPYYPWGLPGGWIELGEDPADTVRRELTEELGLEVEVKELLLCQPQGVGTENGAPLGLGLAYYCRPANGAGQRDRRAAASKAYEVLSVKWVAPARISHRLTRLDQAAIKQGVKAFELEKVGKHQNK